MPDEMIAHYKVTGKLGQGGMGEVYRATDTKLDREVAIKVLPEEFAKHPERLARFEREAKALAKLNHPNIAAIYGFDQHEGQWFLVLELVEGEDLSQRLKRGALPVEEALKIFQQIAKALEAAHEKGIVHRDLKPANIKIDPQGRVKVLDFGLAKARFSSDNESDDSNASTADSMAPTITSEFTMPGKVIGTAAYMSPEQSRGQEVDKRTDVWAFGCCLYEVLTSKRPFTGATTSDLLADILRSDPDFTVIPPETPGEVMTLLRRCLEKDPQRRLRYLGDIAIALEDVTSTSRINMLPTNEVEAIRKSPAKGSGGSWWTKLLVFIGTIIGMGLIYSTVEKLLLQPATDPQQEIAKTVQSIRSIAVLPFTTTGSEGDDAFSDGLTDDMTGMLQKISGLTVRGGRSSSRFKDITDTKQVGELLKVDHLLYGSVSREGNQVRINVNLVVAATDEMLWSEVFDHDLSSIFATRTQVAQEVAKNLKIELNLNEQRSLTQQPTENSEAYALYLQGRAHWNRRTVEDFVKAEHFFNQALELDENYALAYSGLADVHVLWNYYSGEAAAEHSAKTFEFAERAEELDPTLGEPHATLGLAKGMLNWNWEGAEKEFQASIILSPNSANIHHWHANILLVTGRADEALESARRAVQLDPAPVNHTMYVAALIQLGRTDEAVRYLQERLAEDPWFEPYHIWFVQAYNRLEKFEDAAAIVDQMHTAGVAPERVMANRAWVFARMGKTDEARRILNQLEERSGIDLGAFIALGLHCLGDDESALARLEKVVEERGALMNFFYYQSDWESIHDHPRYKAILRKVNLLND